jgi:hypothetical protein
MLFAAPFCLSNSSYVGVEKLKLLLESGIILETSRTLTMLCKTLETQLNTTVWPKSATELPAKKRRRTDSESFPLAKWRTLNRSP